MILGVLSDTHSLLLPLKMLEALKKTDLIIHAGDLCDGEVLTILKGIAPVKAVQGNMDEPALKKKLPLVELFELEGVKFGVYHGHGQTRDALANVQMQLKSASVDIAIFGHSHQPFNERIGDTLYFNPGSPNDVVRAPYFSYGLIELKDGKFNAEIVRI